MQGSRRLITCAEPNFEDSGVIQSGLISNFREAPEAPDATLHNQWSLSTDGLDSDYFKGKE
jgi:hypothetical protein